MRRFIRVCIVCLLIPMLGGADWTQFRGSDSSGLSNEKNIPTTFDEKSNVQWKVDLPGRGPSSPIVVGDRIFVTSSDGVTQNKLIVSCFDAKSGAQLWRRNFWSTGRNFGHPMTANAAPTPASDGKSIFAFFSSNDLICLDLDGNLKWMRGLTFDYPKAANDVGMSSSPVVAGGVVIVQIENQGDSFAAAIDTKTGETKWRVERYPDAAWSSPVLWQPPGKLEPLVFLSNRVGISAHEISSGARVDDYSGRGASIASAVTSGSRVYAPVDGVTALELDGDSTKVVWNSKMLRPSNSSPVVHEGSIYGLNGNVLVGCETETGDRLFQLRLEGSYWATPVVANGHMYILSQEGLASVVKLGDKPELVHQHDFKETFLGTPAIANGAIYFRSDQHLWKIAK